MNKVVIPLATFLLGIFVGAILALVMAPTSGEELRESIRLKAETQWADLSETIREMRQATTALEETNAEMGELVEQSKAS
jgi:gas vesicle protein